MQPEIELLSCFVPKPCYSLEGLCATSYGMDPRILLALVGYTLEAIDTSIDTLQFDGSGKGHLLAALAENMDKVLFIRERGLNFSGDRRKSTPFEILICDHIAGRWARTKKLGSQHAKVILAIYKNEGGDRYGRLYVGSKNLTAGLSKEIGVVIELLPKMARRSHAFHDQLLGFFEDGLRPELERASDTKTKVFEKVVKALKESELGPSNPGLSFLWQSRHGTKASLMNALFEEAGGAKRIDLYSPWADPVLLDALSSHSKSAQMHLLCLKDPRYAYKKRPFLTVHFDGIAKPPEKLTLQHSHAKAYLFSKGTERTLFFGSANFTTSGLGFKTNTRNTEVLLRWPDSANQFKELLQKGAGSDIDDETATIVGLTPAEKLQQEMFNVEIWLEYSDTNGELVFHFRNSPNHLVTVTHLLLEPFTDQGETDFVVISANPLPKTTSVKISEQNFKKVSSRVILSANCKGELVESDLTVDLPPRFYEARSNLRDLAAFRLARGQLIQELLNIADYPSGGGGSGGGEQSEPPGPEVWMRWLEKVHLERFLLRLSRMKKRDPLLFEQRRKRLDRVIVDLKASEDDQLRILGVTLEGVTRALTA
jgi:hypothetical protein